MDKFIARENIRHFHERLKMETDASVRSLLHRLLVQEEDKLGHNHEALRQIENHISRAKEHVNRQQVVLASTERDGHDITHPLALLNNYSEILLSFENQRQKIMIKLEQSLL